MTAQRIAEFDIWRAGYGNALVNIYIAGTTALASVFTDEALTVAADNPQRLLTNTNNNVTYGKFADPLYTAQPYYLIANSVDVTGVQRVPLLTLDGADASEATVVAAGTTRPRPLDEIAADAIYAEQLGSFGDSAAANNAILTAAIGAASAIAGGTDVLLPGLTINFTQLSIPANVRLVGRGRGATILQSQTAGIAITLAGDNSGLARLMLDGVSNVATSVGVYGKKRNYIYFNDFGIRRFETNVFFRGCSRSRWIDFHLSAAPYGAKLYGDSDATNGADGAEFSHNYWKGGIVSSCTIYGVELKDVDLPCHSNTIENVGFESNAGIATKCVGVNKTIWPGCWWSANLSATNLAISDGTDPLRADENRTSGLHFGPAGGFDAGAITITGLGEDILFEGMKFNHGVTITLSTLTNNILALDCNEDSTVTIAGTSSAQWVRCIRTHGDPPTAFGLTNDGTATTAWSLTLDPGQVVNIDAQIIGVQRNGAGYATYHIARPAHRPGSTLGYDAQTANFVLGDTITGGTSGAQARVIADADAGATGTLTLKDITKEFVDNELITGAAAGSAVVNGTLTHQNAALLGATTAVQAATETDAAWDCIFDVSVGSVVIKVTGAAATVVEWSVAATAVSG